LALLISDRTSRSTGLMKREQIGILPVARRLASIESNDAHPSAGYVASDRQQP